MVAKSYLAIMNQLFQLEMKLKKLENEGDRTSIGRNVSRIKDILNDSLNEEGLPSANGNLGNLRLVYDDPLGQAFTETRTELEASISGTGKENLIVVDVIKPIIRMFQGEGKSQIVQIVQKGVVVVESQKEGNHE